MGNEGLMLIEIQNEIVERSGSKKTAEPSNRRDQRSLDRRVWREKQNLKRQIQPQASS
jgi:hypothetical protein